MYKSILKLLKHLVADSFNFQEIVSALGGLPGF